MKKLVLTLTALTLCMATSMEARLFGGDCNSCNKPCKKENPCKTECKPCKREVRECFTCPKPCKYTETETKKIVVPCKKTRCIDYIDYVEKDVVLTREVCPKIDEKIGEWRCCEKDRQAGVYCGEEKCSACRSEKVKKDPVTHMLYNDPLFEEAKNDAELMKKLERAAEYNKTHNVELSAQEKAAAERYEAKHNINEESQAAITKTNEAEASLTKKEKAAQKRANKKAARANKNTEIVAEELDIEAA